MPTAPLEAGQALASALLAGGEGARAAAKFMLKDVCPSGADPWSFFLDWLRVDLASRIVKYALWGWWALGFELAEFGKLARPTGALVITQNPPPAIRAFTGTAKPGWMLPPRPAAWNVCPLSPGVRTAS